MRIKRKLLIENNKIRKEVVKRDLRLDSIAPGLLSDSNRYSSEKGLISLLEPCRATMGCYEIYCLGGNLFDDIERYDTLDEVENRIKKLLL
ncbi:MAG: hypothetical protein HN793_15020 [Rhodospirillaceae bacterium]|nr:hypothetical protein [Rhodospirillaceae bacterium]